MESSKIRPEVKWVKLQTYCDLTGDTPAAVRNRKKRGVWVDGIHCIVRSRHLWINLTEAQKWVAKGKALFLNRRET